MRTSSSSTTAGGDAAAKVAPIGALHTEAPACEPIIQAPPFKIVRITKRGGPLSKKVFRDDSGELKIDSSACAMNRGQARTVEIGDGMAGLAQLYASLKTNEAVVFSNADLGPNSRNICTEPDHSEQRKQDSNIISRSKRFLGAGAAPGLQLFEVDDHGLPPGMNPPDAARMVALLAELLPELDVPGAARLLTHSTSSCIYDMATGKILRGEGGKHLALLLSDQSQAKTLKTLLEVRQWASGHGHIHISSDGRQLERTVFDLSVFAPERLVFEAGAMLGKGLEQRRPAPLVVEGHALDMSRLPLPTLLERERAEMAKRLAKEATHPAAEKVRAQYVRAEAEKLVAQLGILQPEAEAIVTLRVETGSLDDRDVVIFTDRGTPETQTVGHVLDHIEKFIGRAMCDPLEPERGSSKAMILRGPGGQPYVKSYVHGERRFTFERIVGLQGATDRALFDFTDLANAHRIANAFGDDLCAMATGWFVFSGRHWQKGDHIAEQRGLNLSRLVLQDPKYLALVKRIERSDFGTEGEAKLRKQQQMWINFASACEDKAQIIGALNLARTLLWRDIAEMNGDPWLLNVMNGTLDLRTGTLRPHDREDLITTLAPVNYDANAVCPVFKKTVFDIFGGDAELVDFLQRYLGYCLTGVTTEQKVLIPWGDGSNGKTTILGIVQKVLGRDYCGTAPPKLLEATKTDRHPTEIADLYGKRIVIASETEEGAQLREAFLKLATGGDPLKGRFMHKDFFEFDPTHKFILLTNHKPEVKGSDFAIWRRLSLLPFEIIFGDQKAIEGGDATRLKDKSLPDKLSAELDGILAWMVHGCAEWRDKGLAEPTKVVGATAEYREEQDRMGQFIAEQCECGAQYSVGQGLLYEMYQRWTHTNGYHFLGSGKFRKQLLKAMRGKVTTGRITTGALKGNASYDGMRGRMLH